MALSDHTIAELSRRIAGGDTDAFAQFYDAYFDFMLAQARHSSRRDESFCMDVVQDTCLRIIKSLKPVESVAQMERWLRIVVRSCAYDRLRGELRRERREAQRCGDGANRTTCRSEMTEREEQLVWLGAQLSELSDADMRLIALRYRLGWTLERIGRTVRLSPGAVDGRVGRIVRQFRKVAQEKFNEP